jgi:hypothetical protein
MRTHGHSKSNGGRPTPTYESWVAMHTRCTNPKHPKFRLYGGRGITVCERWASFEAFLADMGERPKGTTLDRIDNDRGYERGNCRWATDSEQNSHRSNNHLVKFTGVTCTLAEWARRTGLLKSTIRMRLASGWDVERALTTPARPKKTNGFGPPRNLRKTGVPVRIVVQEEPPHAP